MRTTQILFLLVVLFGLASCTSEPGVKTLKPGETLVVMASTPHLASIAMAIAGDAAEVEMLPGTGTSVHDFEPTVADRRRLQKAHILLINGLELEPWDAVELAKAARAQLVDCSSKLGENWLITVEDAEEEEHDEHAHDDHGHDHGAHDHGEFNPHVWLSVEGAIKQAEVIADAFAGIDASNTETYRENLETLRTHLQTLRDEFKPKLAKLKKTKFVSNHDAFPYLAREFGLEQVGVIQRTPGHSPTIDERRALEEMIKQGGADAIFMEPGFDDASSRVIARNSGLPLATLDPFGVGKPAPDALEKILRQNLQTVLETLE